MRRFLSLLPLCVYGVISLLLFCSNATKGPIFQAGQDPIAYIWFLNWWPYAVVNGINPSISHYIWNPAGFPMWWANSIPTLATLFAPITLAFGAVRTWNALALLAPALNAYSCFLLIRFLTKKRYAAYVGASVFGLSSYVASQQLAHISLSFVPFVPLATLLLLYRLHNEISRAKFIAILSLLGILQFGISTEVLATSAFFGTIAFAIFYCWYREIYDFVGLAKDTAVAGVISMIVLSPALYYMVIGANQVPALINSPTMFSADFLNFLIPNTTTLVGGNAFQEVSSRFTGSVYEQGTYLGVMLVAVLIHAICNNIRKGWAIPLVLVLLATVTCSLGPVLWINGHNTRIALPWKLFLNVPLIKHALPIRFTLYTSLIISIFIGAWLSNSVIGLRKLTARYCLAILSIVMILPNPARFKFENIDTPKLFSKESVDKELGRDANIVVLPYGYFGNSMFWQIQSGMRFKMAGGYVGFSPNYFSKFRATMYFFGAQTPLTQDDFYQDVSEFCGVNNVSAIVITSRTPDSLMASLAALPWKKDVYVDATIVRVPPKHELHYLAISGDYYFNGHNARAWMGAGVSMTNNDDHIKKVMLSRFAAPATVGEIQVLAIVNGVATKYEIVDKEVEIDIPAGGSAKLTSSKTWVPAHYMNNGDPRELSVGLRILN